ncbi:MAG: hypothetical protein K9K64_09545 [Desulfohalobiaceae bacterium]|nr:hypothetical protein [Desulfohalobiaceae bacterium]
MAYLVMYVTTYLHGPASSRRSSTGLDRRLRIKIHQEYFEAVLFRDLIERHNISHPRALTDLAYRLMDNISSLCSINSLTGYLKSLGHKAPKSAVSDYLQWFEDAYFPFSVPLFDASITRSKANPKKTYCVDHAFVPFIASGILLNTGHLLENLVFSRSFLPGAFCSICRSIEKNRHQEDDYVFILTRVFISQVLYLSYLFSDERFLVACKLIT